MGFERKQVAKHKTFVANAKFIIDDVLECKMTNREHNRSTWTPVKVKGLKNQEYIVETLSEVECEEHGFKFIRKSDDDGNPISLVFNSPEADLRRPEGQLKCKLTYDE